MKIFLIALPLCFLGASCERHEFSETRQLHEHGASHEAGAAEHAEEHGEKKADEPAH